MPRSIGPVSKPVTKIAKVIDAKRVEANLSTKQFIIAIGIDVCSRNMYSDIMANRARFPIARLDIAARVLNIEVRDLFAAFLQSYETTLYKAVKGHIIP